MNGNMYLIVVDVVESVVHDNSHSADNNTAPEDIAKFGILESLVSDKGPQHQSFHCVVTEQNMSYNSGCAVPTSLK